MSESGLGRRCVAIHAFMMTRNLKEPTLKIPISGKKKCYLNQLEKQVTSLCFGVVFIVSA